MQMFSMDGSSYRWIRGWIVYNWIRGRIARFGPWPMRDWVLLWPIIDRLGPKARVIIWPKPRGLVYPVYVIKSLQSSMILHADHVLRAVINARLSATLFPPGVIYFYVVPLLGIPYLRSFVYGRRVGEGSSSPSYRSSRAGRSDMSLLDYIRIADPRKVQVVEVQKEEEQVKLLDSIKHCFVSLDPPTVAQQEGGSGSGAGPEVFAPAAEEKVAAENIVSVGTYLDLEDPEDDLLVAGKEDATRKQSDKAKRKKLSKQSDTLPAKRLRVDHPSLASGTGGKSLASLRRTIPEGSLALGPSLQADIHAQVTVQSSHVADVPVYTVADTVTSSRGKTHAASTSDMGGGSRTEHELELKEKLRVKYDAQGVLFKEKDVEIARLKSLVKEKETESAEKETDISLLDSRATYLKSALDDSQAACDEARNLISSLSSERDGLASKVSTLHSAFRDFKEKMEAQQEAQGEFYPAYLTALTGRRWLLTHGMELVMVKCLKSSEYQGILGHALGRAVDYGMQEGLAAGHEHGVAETLLSSVMAYNPKAAEAHYLDAVRALEEADFPLVQLLKSKKDSGIDEVLDCFLLDGPLADLPKAAHLQPCLEQLFVPIYHANIKTVVEETSLSFALLNVHTRAEGARKHAAALRQLMVDIISYPLSSQNLIGEASTSAATFFVEDLDTDEDLGSVVCMPQFEDLRFEIFP
ncbi:hypothetical protein Tco_0487852 [Tanacetum coccineum]